MIEPTAHGNEGVIGRLGLTPFEMIEWLKTARKVTYNEAIRVVSFFNNMKANEYYVAPDPKRPGEKVVIIVRENKVITVMTKLTNLLYGVESEMKNGTRVIRTLDGGSIYDRGNWTRKLRKRTKKESSR